MAARRARPPFAIDAVSVLPSPGMALPTSFTFSRDATRLTYLLGTPDEPVQRLYTLDLASGEASLMADPPGGGIREERLSLEEELRRQRERSLAQGFTACWRAERSDRMLLPVGGDIYVLDGPGEPLRQIHLGVRGSTPVTPQLSPSGEQIAYVREGELYVLRVAGGIPRQLTTGARESGKTHGLAEFIAQEELDRHEGFWWSPDSASIAFAEVDETHIPLYVIPHLGEAATGPSAREEHHYPFAGGPNARVRLAVISATGGVPVWMDLDCDEEIYLARVFWWHDGELGAVLVNRPQSALWLVRFDLASGRRRTVLEERSEYWVNLPHRTLAQLDGGDFVWASERTGFRHLYRYGVDGSLRAPLTQGDWMVDEIAGVDERAGMVYFTGNREDPREKQLYAVGLDGGEVRRLTEEPGTHEITLEGEARWYVDVHSAVNAPPCVAVRALNGGADAPARGRAGKARASAVSVPVARDRRLDRFGLEPPELVTLHNRTGTQLYGAVYRPPASFGGGPHPTIVQVYGGPNAQMVTNSWGRMTAALNIQYLRALGFLIFRLDNRGSARRGLDFEAALRHAFGSVEVDDQVDGVRWLIERRLADPRRVGIFGWSYGGYMTLMCLARAPEVFKVGVAGAPVTAQDAYDTAYSERYMGMPSENAAGYHETSVLTHAANIRGKLLLIHGMLDENVHFRHTARLLEVLTQAGRPYDIALFADERHMPRHPANRVYLDRRLIGYFRKHL